MTRCQLFEKGAPANMPKLENVIRELAGHMLEEAMLNMHTRVDINENN